MHRKVLLAVSRPRFWLYTFGPFLIAWIAGFSLDNQGFLATQEVIRSAYNHSSLLYYTLFTGFCFLIPANIFIYGVNDIADKETDEHNNKKGTYEIKLGHYSLYKLKFFIYLSLLCFVVLGVFSYDVGLLQLTEIICSIGGFFFFGAFYSLPPIRAKSIPFLDGFFNILYLFGIPFGWVISGHHLSQIPLAMLIASVLFMMAWHTFSAIPDIEPDKASGITTTAVFLGYKTTLVYCFLLGLIASLLVGQFIGRFALPLGLVFCGLCLASYFVPIFRVYTTIPWIVPLLGTFYFWLLILL